MFLFVSNIAEMKRFNYVFCFLIFLLPFKTVNAQIQIFNCEENLNDYTLIIQDIDPTDSDAVTFMRRLNETWTISRLEFYGGEAHNLALVKWKNNLTKDIPNFHFNRFVSLSDTSLKNVLLFTSTYSYTVNVDPIKSTSGYQNPDNYSSGWSSSGNSYFYWLELYSAKSASKEEKNSYSYAPKIYAHVLLCPPRPSKTKGIEYVTLNYGYMLNYLTIVQACLKRGGTSRMNNSHLPVSEKQLRRLDTLPLYIPNYCFSKYIRGTGSTYVKISEKKLMSEYKYPYIRISEDSLGHMILNSKEDFYYLLYIRNMSDKFKMIINGHTGEILYYTHQPVAWNLKKRDFRQIMTAISGL